jgi:hypothetical protein
MARSQAASGAGDEGSWVTGFQRTPEQINSRMLNAITFGQTLHNHRLARSQSNLCRIHIPSYVTFVPLYTISTHHSKRKIANKPAHGIPSMVQRISKVSRKRQRVYIRYGTKSTLQRQGSNKNQDQIAYTHADMLTEIQQPPLRQPLTFFPVTVIWQIGRSSKCSYKTITRARSRIVICMCDIKHIRHIRNPILRPSIPSALTPANKEKQRTRE